MLSPITLVATPIVLIASLITVFFLVPTVDPSLTLNPDVPFTINSDRYTQYPEWEPYYGSHRPFLMKMLQGLQYCRQKGGVGIFTCNHDYPFLDLKVINGVTLVTKDYAGAACDLLKISPSGEFSFSWPSEYHNKGNTVDYFSFKSVYYRSPNDGDSLPYRNPDDPLLPLYDWYRSWARLQDTTNFERLLFTDAFCFRDEDVAAGREPCELRLVTFTHQRYTVVNNEGCDGYIYDTTKLVPQYEEPILYTTADLVNQPIFGQPSFDLWTEESRPRFKIFDLIPTVSPHNSDVTDFPAFWTSMIKGMGPSRDFILIHLEGAGSYSKFDPGSISDGSSPGDNCFPKILIFVACVATLTLWHLAL